MWVFQDKQSAPKKSKAILWSSTPLEKERSEFSSPNPKNFERVKKSIRVKNARRKAESVLKVRRQRGNEVSFDSNWFL